MIRFLFESFYIENIERIAKEICAVHDCLDYAPNLGGVYEEYLNQRTLLKALIKKKEKIEGGKAPDLLDGHKVAACITCAIIKVRLVSSSETEDDELKEDDEPKKVFRLESSNRMNEQIALLSGLSCLVAYMIANKTNLYPIGKTSGKVDLRFPETNYPGKPPYIDSLIRALYYSNTLSVNNPLLLAHIFFFIERHHRTLIELENIKATYGVMNKAE